MSWTQPIRDAYRHAHHFRTAGITIGLKGRSEKLRGKGVCVRVGGCVLEVQFPTLPPSVHQTNLRT